MTPLDVRRITLAVVSLATLKSCVDTLYMEHRSTVKYTLLSMEDYQDIRMEAYRSWGGKLLDRGQLTSFYGLLIAPLMDIPRGEDYAQARLSVEWLEYAHLKLRKGEVLLLYEDKHIS